MKSIGMGYSKVLCLIVKLKLCFEEYLIDVFLYVDSCCNLKLVANMDSMAVRDLSNVVKPDDIISTEHLTTLLVVVSKYSQKDWLASYETLSNFVVC
jgi:hypothetical protein